ncbi:MAG: thioredoxin family protein [Candidatus Izimaplasma sp.]|nr:thioredoxin family protein [Candidatus Izimaplasma bacterium]
MTIKILGSDCPNCIRLEKNVVEALKEMDKKANIEKVTEIKDIMSYHVMSTPALVVDGKVLFSGKVPNTKRLQEILK